MVLKDTYTNKQKKTSEHHDKCTDIDHQSQNSSKSGLPPGNSELPGEGVATSPEDTTGVDHEDPGRPGRETGVEVAGDAETGAVVLVAVAGFGGADDDDFGVYASEV